MTGQVDHWQALFDHTYLRWFDLKGKPALCQIVAINPLVEMTLPGGKKTRKPVLELKQVQGAIENATDDRGKRLPTIKPLVLNATNGSAVAEMHGNAPSQWVGKQIVLYQDVTKVYNKVTRKMEDKDCIRIRAAKQ